jgi:hypothetical protein
MSKYDSLREWHLVKARREWPCDNCGVRIPARADYWAERIGGGVRTRGLELHKLCSSCWQSSAQVPAAFVRGMRPAR